MLETKNHHQRGEVIMTQNLLPFKYEIEKETQGLTGLAGLPAYLELACKMGLSNLLNLE